MSPEWTQAEVASPTGFGTAVATRSVATLTGIRWGRSNSRAPRV